MVCRITDMHAKEVINLCDGCRLGCVDDVEVDVTTARLEAIVLFGRPKWFGLFGREEDIVIPWCEIEVIGDDTVLVRHTCPPCHHRRRRPTFLGGLFRE